MGVASALSESGRRDGEASPRSSKAGYVYETIKEAILSGELAPGTAIDKAALCDRLGMSRFPVTTAVNRLGFEKLVVIEPQHGSFVSRISIRNVREFMMIRRALEAEIAAQAAAIRPPGIDRGARAQPPLSGSGCRSPRFCRLLPARRRVPPPDRPSAWPGTRGGGLGSSAVPPRTRPPPVDGPCGPSAGDLY